MSQDKPEVPVTSPQDELKATTDSSFSEPQPLNISHFIQENLTWEAAHKGAKAALLVGGWKFATTFPSQPISNAKNWQQFESGPNSANPRALSLVKATSEMIANTNLHKFLGNCYHAPEYWMKTAVGKLNWIPYTYIITNRPIPFALKRYYIQNRQSLSGEKTALIKNFTNISLSDFLPLFRGGVWATITQTSKGILKGPLFLAANPLAEHLVTSCFPDGMKNEKPGLYNGTESLATGLIISSSETAVVVPFDRIAVSKSTQQGIHAKISLWDQVSWKNGVYGNLRIFYTGGLMAFLKTLGASALLFYSKKPITDNVNAFFEVPEGQEPSLAINAISSIGMSSTVAFATAFLDILKTNLQAAGAKNTSAKDIASFIMKTHGPQGFMIGLPAKLFLISAGWFPLALTACLSTPSDKQHTPPKNKDPEPKPPSSPSDSPKWGGAPRFFIPPLPKATTENKVTPIHSPQG